MLTEGPLRETLEFHTKAKKRKKPFGVPLKCPIEFRCVFTCLLVPSNVLSKGTADSASMLTEGPLRETLEFHTKARKTEKPGWGVIPAPLYLLH